MPLTRRTIAWWPVVRHVITYEETDKGRGGALGARAYAYGKRQTDRRRQRQTDTQTCRIIQAVTVSLSRNDPFMWSEI